MELPNLTINVTGIPEVKDLIHASNERCRELERDLDLMREAWCESEGRKEYLEEILKEISEDRPDLNADERSSLRKGLAEKALTGDKRVISHRRA